MVNDLTSLFEAAGGFQTMRPEHISSAKDFYNREGSSDSPVAENVHLFGEDENLSNILKELF